MLKIALQLFAAGAVGIVFVAVVLPFEAADANGGVQQRAPAPTASTSAAADAPLATSAPADAAIRAASAPADAIVGTAP